VADCSNAHWLKWEKNFFFPSKQQPTRFPSLQNVHTGSWGHPAHYSMCTGFLSWGVKSSEREVDHHLQILPRLKISRDILPLQGPGKRRGYSDSLRAGRSGDRIPVGTKFSAPVQTSPGTHPASYTMGTGSFPGVKRPGRGVDHPTPSSAEVEGRVELYICSPSRSSWPVLGWTLPLYRHSP
jgi:hypothetical protein